MRGLHRPLLVSLTILFWTSAVSATPNIRLTNDAAASIRPRCCLDASGNVIVVWEDGRFGNDEILWQKFDQVGTPITAVVRVTNTAAKSAKPDVACDAGGTSHIVWQEGEDGNGVGTVYICRLDPSGTKTLGDLLVKDFSGDARLACPSSGTTDLFWARYTATDQDVYYRRYNSSGAQTCEKRFNEGTIPAIAKMPAICNASSGDAQLFWRDMNTSFQVHLRQGTATNACGSGQATAYSSSAAQNPSTDVGGPYVYTLFEVSGNIYNFQGAPNACKLSQGAGTSTRPSVSADVNQGYAVWRDSRDGNSEIYFCRFFGCPSSTGDIRLTNDVAASEDPDIAVEESGTGRWVAVWSDGRDGNREIYLTSQSALDTPEPPSSLGATLTCPPGATLTWHDNSLNETRFELETRMNGGLWTSAGTTAADQTSATVGGETYGAGYDLHVRACAGTLCSAWSNVASVTVPGLPVQLTGHVQAFLARYPQTPSPIEQPLLDVRVQLRRIGASIAEAQTNLTDGGYTLSVAPHCDDQVAVTLISPTLDVAHPPVPTQWRCTFPDNGIEFITQAVGYTPSLDLVWPSQANGSSGDAANLAFLAERYARLYAVPVLGVTLDTKWSLKPFTDVGQAFGGAATSWVESKPARACSSFEQGVPLVPSPVYHEFIHRLVIEETGNLLGQGSISQSNWI